MRKRIGFVISVMVLMFVSSAMALDPFEEVVFKESQRVKVTVFTDGGASEDPFRLKLKNQEVPTTSLYLVFGGEVVRSESGEIFEVFAEAPKNVIRENDSSVLFKGVDYNHPLFDDFAIFDLDNKTIYEIDRIILSDMPVYVLRSDGEEGSLIIPVSKDWVSEIAAFPYNPSTEIYTEITYTGFQGESSDIKDYFKVNKGKSTVEFSGNLSAIPDTILKITQYNSSQEFYVTYVRLRVATATINITDSVILPVHSDEVLLIDPANVEKSTLLKTVAVESGSKLDYSAEELSTFFNSIPEEYPLTLLIKAGDQYFVLLPANSNVQILYGQEELFLEQTVKYGESFIVNRDAWFYVTQIMDHEPRHIAPIFKNANDPFVLEDINFEEVNHLVVTIDPIDEDERFVYYVIP